MFCFLFFLIKFDFFNLFLFRNDLFFHFVFHKNWDLILPFAISNLKMYPPHPHTHKKEVSRGLFAYHIRTEARRGLEVEKMVKNLMFLPT